MPADGYLRRVLTDGALPFRYRGGVRALLGEPDGPGLLRATPPAPQPQFSYPRSAWLGEIELPDGIPTMAREPLNRPAGNDRPRGHQDRGTAAGGISRGRPDEPAEPATDHPSALPRPAAGAARGPRPEAAAGPSAVMEASPAPVAGSAHPPEPHAGPRTDTRPGLARPATAATQRGPEPTASAGGGSRELLIPGRTVRSSVMTASEEVSAGLDPSGPTRHLSQGHPGGPLRRSGAEPAGITGREPALTDGSSVLGTPDPARTVRRIPPRHTGATARKHDGGTVIPGGQATPLRVPRPTGPGRQADAVPPRQADALPPRPADALRPRRPPPEAGIRSRAEQPSATPPAAAPVSAPQLIVMLPPRTPTAPPAFWERRHLGRLWSRPLR